MTTVSRIYTDMIDDLVRDLSGRNDIRRVSAVERCAGLPEDLLLEIMSRLLHRYHKLAAWRWAVYFLGAVGAVSFASLLQGNSSFAFGILGFAAAAHLQLTYRNTGRSLQAMMATSEDHRFIPILLLKYSPRKGAFSKPQLLRIRDLGLTQLLPYVNESDEEMWTPQMRAALTSLLRHPYRNPDLTQCALGALGEVGDDSSVARLDAIIRGDSSATSQKPAPVSNEAIVLAARHCKGAIQARTDRKRQQLVLLRACALDLPDRISLPRPVEPDSFSGQHELLRSLPNTSIEG
jgi:hypothetical protein